MGIGVTDGFARGGGRGGAPSGLGVGKATQGAAMATQQRLTPLSTPPGPQIGVPHTGNPLSQSTLSTHPATMGPGSSAADGGHLQPTQSELPEDVRKKEGSISASDRALDRVLTICRGC
jgi:hypothetical protein